MLRITIPGENVSLRLKIQFAANSFIDGKEARVHFVKMLERFQMIDKVAEIPIVPSVPIITQAGQVCIYFCVPQTFATSCHVSHLSIIAFTH